MMFDEVVGLALKGELYPSVILHGASVEERQERALELARALLWEGERDLEGRPTGVCPHARRIAWPGERPEGAEHDPFHPDFQVLERDLKTSTSVDAVKRFLTGAQVAPFEARGQVFVVGSAESLTGEAANALLKMLEEPHQGAPRNFLLLAPSQFDLLPTLRSRSLAVYLGGEAALDGALAGAEEVGVAAEHFRDAVAAFAKSGAPVFLLTAAQALATAPPDGWKDPRSGRPWSLAARSVLAALELGGLDEAPGLRRRLLALAEGLLGAPRLRIRGITAERILEGLVTRHLAAAEGYSPLELA